MILAALKQKLENRFVRNMGWMGASELVIRLFRLLATVMIARLLTPHDYGLAAVVLTANEFVYVFTRNGIDAKLVQCDEKDLEALSNTGYWLNWLLSGALFLIQCALALPIAWFYGDLQIAAPLCVIAFVYLLVPIALVQSALIQRENRLKVLATSNAAQISADNVLTVVFALLGFGLWAIVLPKVLVAPIWVAINYFNHPWRAPKAFTCHRWREIVDFGKHVTGIELLSTLRNNVDYLLVGKFLGIEALGIYYFAFNAGLGLSLGLINAVNAALYPHLCAANRDLAVLKERYFEMLRTIARTAVPLILVQSALAPIYVPLVFGAKWGVAVPIVTLVCLSAVPRLFAAAASQLLRSLGRPEVDLQWNVVFTLILIAALFAGVQWGMLGVAFAVLIAHATAMPAFAIWSARRVFGHRSPFALDKA